MTGVTFGYEAQRRLRVAFLGTSGHGFRNFLPSLPFAPVELVGLWDDDRARGEAMARGFGAAAHFAEIDRLFDEAKPEAVLIAAEPAGREGPDNALLMAQCLERGCHAWTDKPLATFRSGAVGTFHFVAGQSGTSLLERLEVIGDGANVVVENATRVTYYRKGSPGAYGRTPSYLTGADQAPLCWEPELTLGQLYNTNSFIQGYAQSIIAIVAAAIGDAPLEFGTLEDGLEILKIFEALRESPGHPVTLPAG